MIDNAQHRPSAAELIAARTSLHAVAELLLAGPQYRLTKELRLAVTDSGFRTGVPLPGAITGLSVDAAAVTREPEGVAVPLAGPVAGVAAALGVEAGGPDGAYGDTGELGPDAMLTVPADAAAELLAALTTGDAALRALVREAGAVGRPDTEPILWPEHFDVGISLDEVNYGVSPGDAGHDEPYAYVGPWTPREGDFWNEPFGAAVPMRQLAGVPAVLAFFTEGRRIAAG